VDQNAFALSITIDYILLLNTSINMAIHSVFL